MCMGKACSCSVVVSVEGKDSQRVVEVVQIGRQAEVGMTLAAVDTDDMAADLQFPCWKEDMELDSSDLDEKKLKTLKFWTRTKRIANTYPSLV